MENEIFKERLLESVEQLWEESQKKMKEELTVEEYEDWYSTAKRDYESKKKVVAEMSFENVDEDTYNKL